jgi:hypothetical protein
MLGLDKNTIDFGTIRLGSVALPIWMKLKIQNYSNEDFEVNFLFTLYATCERIQMATKWPLEYLISRTGPDDSDGGV